MSGDRVEYEGRMEGMAGDLVRQIPATLKCRSCGKVMFKSQKDHKRQHMSLDIVTRTPPEVLHDGAVMCLVCDGCRSKTLIQIRA